VESSCSSSGIFNEEQPFEKKWKWLYYLLVLLLLLVLYNAVKSPDVNNIGGFCVVLLACLIITLLLRTFKLSTQIDSSGISYKFPPAIPDWERISWHEIRSVEVVSYNPIADFGGWGIRITGTKSAYIVSGNEGLQIALKTGSIVMIGTNKAPELTIVTQQYNSLI